MGAISWASVDKKDFGELFQSEPEETLAKLTHSLSLELFSVDWCGENKIRNLHHKLRLISTVLSLTERTINKESISLFFIELQKVLPFSDKNPMVHQIPQTEPKEKCDACLFEEVLKEAINKKKDNLANTIIRYRCNPGDFKSHLINAAAKGCLETVKELYLKHEALIAKELTNQAALEAFKFDRFETLSFLSEKGEFEPDEEKGLELLHLACSRVCLNSLKILLEKFSSSVLKNLLDMPLPQTKRAALETLYLALDGNCSSKSREKDNLTVIEMENILLSHGASPNCLTKDGVPLIHSILSDWAWKDKEHHFIQLLISHGENPNLLYSGLTPLHSLFVSNKTVTAPLLFMTLIHSKGDISETGEVGCAPIPFALREEKFAVLKEIFCDHSRLLEEIQKLKGLSKTLILEEYEAKGIKWVLELIVLFQDKELALFAVQTWKGEDSNFQKSMIQLEEKYGLKALLIFS